MHFLNFQCNRLGIVCEVFTGGLNIQVQLTKRFINRLNSVAYVSTGHAVTSVNIDPKNLFNYN